MKASAKWLVIGGLVVLGALLVYLLVRSGAASNPLSQSPDALASKLILPTTQVEGPASSTVTIVEFLDYECPACGGFNPTMMKIRQEYAGKIQYAVRLFPLVEIHQYAKGAAIAAVCAGKQGKFFEYGDALFANQQHLERADLIHYADALHLDTKAFNTCLDDQSVADFVVSERKAADTLGLDHTPTIFVNGEMLDAIPTQAQLEQIINQRLK
jgi:protein-disulfide isomerase